MTRLHPSLTAALAALLLTTTLPAAQAQDAAKAARFYEDALQRYEKRDIPGAIVQLRNALQADKTQLSVHVLLGKALLADSQPSAAEFQFVEAMRLGVDRAEVAVPLAMALNAQGKQAQMLEDPRLQPAGLPTGLQLPLLLQRSLAYSDLGDTKNAMAAVQQARSLNAADPNTWIAEVPLRVRARQFTEALAAADQALKLDPNNAEALYQRGATLHAMSQVPQALASYDAAIKAWPEHAEARLARAGLLIDLGRDAQALAEVEELHRLKPKDPRGTYLRALLAERAGDKAEAKAALKRITELLDPVPIEYIRFRPQLLMLNGLAHYSLGELEKSKPFLELATRQQPGSPLVKLLAQLAIAEPNPNRAIELLDGYVKSQPGDGQALLMLASVYMSQGKHARATALMQEALKTRDSAEYRTALGLSLLQSGKASLGADELSKAYKADPKQTYAGLALVTIHLREGQTAKALAVADSLARSNPTNATVLTVQALAQAEAKDFAAARAGYEKALKLDPTLSTAKLGLARLETQAGNYDAANKRLRDMLRNDERNVNVLLELALLHELWRKPDETLKWLESAVAASGPREARADFALVAWHLQKSGQPHRALEAAKVLLAKLPEDVEALQAYAAAQMANGDAAGAKLTLTNAGRRAAFDAPRLVEVARQQVAIKDFSGAAYNLDKALNAAPDFVPALAMLSSVDLAQGDVAAAERRARQVIQASPKSALGYNLLAEVAHARAQPTLVLDSLRKAHELDKTQASLAKLMRVTYNQNGAKPALDLGEAWLRHNPGDLSVRSVMAEINVRAGNFAAARKQYEAILKQRPQHAETLNSLANLLMEIKDPGALAMAERAYQADPRNPLLMDTAGWANHLAGNSERALQLLRDARLRAPDVADIRYHLGAVLAKAGRRAEAREELQAALKANVKFSSLDAARKLLATLNQGGAGHP